MVFYRGSKNAKNGGYVPVRGTEATISGGFFVS